VNEIQIRCMTQARIQEFSKGGGGPTLSKKNSLQFFSLQNSKSNKKKQQTNIKTKKQGLWVLQQARGSRRDTFDLARVYNLAWRRGI
jgi:hypothetical protein